MPQAHRAGPYPLPGVATETWLVRFDKNGVCTSPQTRAALLDKLAASSDARVLVFSHGWNNDFEDAAGLYASFLKRLEDVLKSHPLPGRPPIFVGITWPSIWLPSDEGPQLASSEKSLADATLRDRLVRELLETLPPGTDWSRLYALLDAKGLNLAEANELVALVKPIFRGEEVGAQEAAASEDNILKAMRDLQAVYADNDAPDLDDIGTVGGGPSAPGTAGVLDYLDPRWALRLTTLYLMKDRAGTVGWKGVGALLRDILTASSAPVHGVGHSYGCKVVLSALSNIGAAPRKMQSLLLLQPAVSHLSFAATVPGRPGPGGYRNVIERVAGPIFSTYSANDFPLHSIYHRALLRSSDLGELQVAAGATSAGNPPNAYAAMGGYGPRGVNEHLIDPIPAPGEPINYPAGKRVVGLDGSKFKRIDGHGGVANPHTAWALRAQMNS